MMGSRLSENNNTLSSKYLELYNDILTIRAIDGKNEKNESLNSEELLTRIKALLLKLDKLCIDTRKFYVSKLDDKLSYAERKWHYDKYLKESSSLGFKITEKDGIIRFVIPSLLPRTKDYGEWSMLSLIWASLDNYVKECEFKGTPHKPIDDALIVITQHYKSSNLVRDADNNELKQVVDALWFNGIIKSDGGLNCKVLMQAKIGKNTKTIIEIVDTMKKDTSIEEIVKVINNR